MLTIGTAMKVSYIYIYIHTYTQIYILSLSLSPGFSSNYVMGCRPNNNRTIYTHTHYSGFHPNYAHHYKSIINTHTHTFFRFLR